MKRSVMQGICLFLVCIFLSGCCLNIVPTKTLKQALQADPSALDSIRYTENKRLQFSDYIVYNAGEGMRDDLNATRYASGLEETFEQFVTYRYVVESRNGDWKYFFEDFDDIAQWALSQ